MRRKSLSPAIIKATHSGAFYFASKPNARWILPKRSCAKRSQNKTVAAICLPRRSFAKAGDRRMTAVLIDIRGNLKRRIANARELPIPWLPGEAMPLQLERCGQFVDAFVEHSHHTILAAIDGDFAGPDRAPQFNLHSRIECKDPGPAHPSKAFPHAFEKTRLIVAPLILVIIANKIGYSLPVSVVNCVKEIFRVQPDLMLSSPKPEQIHADNDRNR